MTARLALTLLALTLACAAVPTAAAHASPPKPWSVVVEHCNTRSYQHYRDHRHADALYRVKRDRFRTDRSLAVVAEEHRGRVVRIVQRRCGA